MQRIDHERVCGLPLRGAGQVRRRRPPPRGGRRQPYSDECDAEYIEEEAAYLAAYAQNYHDLRRSPWEDRNGHGFFTPVIRGRTPYKDKAGGTTNRRKVSSAIGAANVRRRPIDFPTNGWGIVA